MKKFSWLLTGLVISMSVLLGNPAGVSAAGCSEAEVAKFGAVNMDLPKLPKEGNYGLWVRMQSPAASGRVLIELNGDNCLEIAPTNMVPGQWSWHTYAIGGERKLLTFDQADGHKLKIIGASDGLKIDQVIVAVPDCIPSNLSQSCLNATTLKVADQEVIQLPPPTQGLVSGPITLSQTPGLYTNILTSVSYTINGQTLQTSQEVAPFDTTLVANGVHTVLITTTLDDGSIIRESTVIEVDNKETALSPIWRWIRINIASIKLVGIVAGSIVAFLLLLGLIRRAYMNRRLRSFHGF